MASAVDVCFVSKLRARRINRDDESSDTAALRTTLNSALAADLKGEAATSPSPAPHTCPTNGLPTGSVFYPRNSTLYLLAGRLRRPFSIGGAPTAPSSTPGPSRLLPPGFFLPPADGVLGCSDPLGFENFHIPCYDNSPSGRRESGHCNLLQAGNEGREGDQGRRPQ